MMVCDDLWKYSLVSSKLVYLTDSFTFVCVNRSFLFVIQIMIVIYRLCYVTYIVTLYFPQAHVPSSSSSIFRSETAG